MSTPKRSSWVAYGAAMMARGGETSLGDRYVVKHGPGGVLVTVIDGLGHGSEAARAADIAVRVVEASASMELEDLLGRCHQELRESRGVVMTAAALEAGSETMRSVGVGNVHGMIVHGYSGESRPERDFVLLRGGVVGHIMPPLRVTAHPFGTGDTLILATDGVGIEFTTEDRLDGDPQAIAERILSRYAMKTDDALVLVVRRTGP